MESPLIVEATRGSVVDAQHRVHAVAVRGGGVLAAAGDAGLVCFLRSSAKPIQALPLVRARPDLDPRLIAIACASHLARPEQVDAVRRLLAAAPAEERELECGPPEAVALPPAPLRTGELRSGRPAPIEHNCSGKHAGMLALCRARGWPSEGYRLPDHPCQQAMLAEVAEAAEVDAAEIPVAADGCGVVTFALPLWRSAHAFARLPGLLGGERVLSAMRAYAELLRGPVAADAILTRTLPGWAAKGGAEGLFCATGPGGIGVALKAEDGAFRALQPALGAFLRRLGHEPGEIGDVTLTNSRGEPVGVLRAR